MKKGFTFLPIPRLDKKERKCLKCEKKVVGDWLCERCLKKNTEIDYLFEDYEHHTYR